MQKVTKLLLVLLMLPLAFASAVSNKKVSEKRMAAYLMVFHRDGETYGSHTVVHITEKEAKRILNYELSAFADVELFNVEF